MSTRSSASTLTQTWQVGPGRLPLVGSTQEDLENTLTALQTRSVFRIFSRNGILLRAIDLAPGTHSFFLEENESVAHSLGHHPNAEFEINIYTEGGFFVDVTGRRSALVNGRECFWTRLRSGDEIQFGREKWVLESLDTGGLEETIAKNVIDSNVGNNVGNAVLVFPSESVVHFPQPQATQAPKPKPRAKLVVFVSVAAIAMSLSSAYIGYGLAKEQQVTYVAAKKNVAYDAVPAQVVQEGVNGKPSDAVFDERSFTDVLQKFRLGRDSEACASLAERTLALNGNGVWEMKARMLFERKCR